MDPHNPPDIKDKSLFATDFIGAITTNKSFCCTTLMKRQDWKLWNKSEHKQLNSYETQSMFGIPCEAPPHSNVMLLIWTYFNKVRQDTQS